MTEKTIKDITIQLDEHGKISSVTINGKNIRDDIIFPQLHLIKFNFNRYRPDNADVIFPDEYKPIFESVFSAVDELYSSNEGCLAAYLSSYLFESFIPFWNRLLEEGRHILAVLLWREVLTAVHKWERKTGKHIHKGSPYAFIANTHLIIGDIDTGFSYIYNAIEDDIKLNNVCPELNYPTDAPVYLTATLSSNPRNIMFPLVSEIRTELEKYLNKYRSELGRTSSIAELDQRFLQNPALEIIKYFFVFSFWTIFEYQRKVSHDLMQNDFAKLKNANWFFALCLVIDKLFHNIPRYRSRFIGSEIVKYVVDKGWMTRDDLNSLKDNENIPKGKPNQVISRLLTTTLHHNGVPIRKEIQYLFIAWNLRNFAGHNIQTQNVIINNFEELLKILLFDIFLITEEY